MALRQMRIPVLLRIPPLPEEGMAMMLCETCKGSGEVPNTSPDCYIGGMETVIDYPDFIDCPTCKGTGEGAFCPVTDTGCPEIPICPWPCKKLPINAGEPQDLATLRGLTPPEADSPAPTNAAPQAEGITADSEATGACLAAAAPRTQYSMTRPELVSVSPSWVIREKATDKVICETFNPELVKALNTEKYEAVPIQKYLASLNASSTSKT